MTWIFLSVFILIDPLTVSAEASQRWGRLSPITTARLHTLTKGMCRLPPAATCLPSQVGRGALSPPFPQSLSRQVWHQHKSQTPGVAGPASQRMMVLVFQGPGLSLLLPPPNIKGSQNLTVWLWGQRPLGKGRRLCL